MCSIEWCHFRWPWVTRTPVSRSQYSLKANILETVHPIHSMFGSRLGFWDRRIEWRYFRFDNVQDGSWWPSWNDGAVPLRQLGFLVSVSSQKICCSLTDTLRLPLSYSLGRVHSLVSGGRCVVSHYKWCPVALMWSFYDASLTFNLSCSCQLILNCHRVTRL